MVGALKKAHAVTGYPPEVVPNTWLHACSRPRQSTDLDIVFAKDAVPGIVGLSQSLHRLCLAHGNQPGLQAGRN